MAEARSRGRVEMASARAGAAERLRVIYMMGAGHSGSTILGVALGNCEGVFYAGEVEEWLVNSGESPIGGTDLFLIYLVREPQAVVSSELRGIHRHNIAERRLRTLVTNANLWLTNLLSVLVFGRHPSQRRLFVRHEDFLANPAATVERILE